MSSLKVLHTPSPLPLCGCGSRRGAEGVLSVSLSVLLPPSGTPPPLNDITSGSRAPLIYMRWAPSWSWFVLQVRGGARGQMAALAIQRTDNFLHTFLQDRTPSSSPEGAPNALSFLATTCSQAWQVGGAMGSEGSQFPYESTSQTTGSYYPQHNSVAQNFPSFLQNSSARHHLPGGHMDEGQQWWSLPQTNATPSNHHFSLGRQLVLGHQPQIAALLQGTSKGLLSSTRRCRRCKCPNCQANGGGLEFGKKRLHICHIPECGKLLSSCPRRQRASEFIGRPRQAEPGCWGDVRLRGPTVEPGSQHQQAAPSGSPLLLSAGDRGNIHHNGGVVRVKGWQLMAVNGGGGMGPQGAGSRQQGPHAAAQAIRLALSSLVLNGVQLGLTIEEVALAVQDLNHIVDPGPADLRGRGQQLEAHHAAAPTLMLFLKMYPGRENPFFLSIGSLKMASCSNRKIRLSLARDKKPLSCSVTVKVSCCSSFPWAVILPWSHSKDKHNKPRKWLQLQAK
ncbi:hypothetical protein F7725_000680 [Dissostichus mawsoni]|uniref:Uncharacterized protein n=1 Tax=Dissostichus mawsoni TaxID=36200 RepID=A0A7J5ZF39_DISMA|nr:hypothetical protein F7725_000680 [Dissostichus mawsoni]